MENYQAQSQNYLESNAELKQLLETLSLEAMKAEGTNIVTNTHPY